MADPDVPPRRAAVLLVLGSACYAAFTFAWFTLPAFLPPIVAELGLSNTLAGIVTGAIPLTYIPIALASGLVIDRIGAGRAIGIGLAVLGGAQALRSTADGFLALLVLTVALGVGGTGITFGLPKLVSEVVPANRRGSATSVYLVGASLGTAAAFSVGRPILGPLLGGWRGVFLASGLAIVGVALVWFGTARGIVRRHGTGGETDRSWAGIRSDVHTVVTNRALRLIVVVGTMYLLIMHGAQAWIATMFEGRGLSAALAAGLTTLLILARTTGVLLVPPISDVLGRRREVLIACGGLAAGGIGALVLTAANPWLSGIVLVVAGLGLGGISPMVRTLPIELPEIGPRLTGTATGLVFAIGEIGGFLGPFLVGSLYDLTGTYAAGLGVLALGGLVVAGAGVLLPETGAGGRQS